jgi:hypothetical protein
MTSEINKLKDEVSKLKALLESQKTSLEDKVSIDRNKIPSDGCSAEQVKTFIEDEILLDVAPCTQYIILCKCPLGGTRTRTRTKGLGS